MIADRETIPSGVTKLNTTPTKLLASTDMRIVSMLEFRGKIYVACEYAIFVHDPAKGDFDFTQMRLVEIPPDK